MCERTTQWLTTFQVNSLVRLMVAIGNDDDDAEQVTMRNMY